jgi:CubicO group peptidase (beta-lactamase class C family)
MHLVRLVALTLLLGIAPPTFAQLRATPEQVNQAVEALKPLLSKWSADKLVPGFSIAIVSGDRVVFMQSYGVRDMTKAELVTNDTVFQIASMSKSVSSTVIAALVSKKLVSWDSLVSDLDPVFRLSVPFATSQLTIRDLFSHRSGLPGTAGDDLEDFGYSQSEILRRLRYAKPSSSFRAGYSYSNFGLTEGAVAAAKAVGKPWPLVAEEQLFRPLGMSSTSARYEDFVKRPNRAALHVKVDDKWTSLAVRKPDAQAPAGGVSSSIRDLAQWVRMELAEGMYEGKQIVSKEAMEESRSPVVHRGGSGFYGLGWNVSYGPYGPRIGHAGAFSVGARTVVTLLPEHDLGIVVLSNAFPTGLPEAVTDTFLDLTFHGKVTRDWLVQWNTIFGGLQSQMDQNQKVYATPPTPVRPAMPNSAYVGTYHNDYFGTVSVIEQRGGLAVQLGPHRQPFLLKHYSGDLFLYFGTPESPKTPYAITFTIGSDGKATDLILLDYPQSGNDRLKRVSAN